MGGASPSAVGSTFLLRGLKDELSFRPALSEINFVDDAAFGILSGRPALQHLVEFTDSCLPISATAGTGQVLSKVVVAVGHVFEKRGPPVGSGVSAVTGERGHIIGARTSSQEAVAIDNENCGPEVPAGGLVVISPGTAAEQLQPVV